MNAKRMIAPYLTPSSVNLFKPECKSQFRLIQYLNSTKMNDFLIDTSVPTTLYSNFLTKKSFKSDGNLLKSMTN